MILYIYVKLNLLTDQNLLIANRDIFPNSFTGVMLFKLEINTS